MVASGSGATGHRSTTPPSPSRSPAATSSSRCGSRAHFDSVYSVAITEKAVYIGGHFSWNESPTAPTRGRVWTTSATAPARACRGYGLGDAVVRRDHLGALTRPPARRWSGTRAPARSRATRRWRPRLAGCSPVVTRRTQGGVNIGRVAFYDFNTLPAPSALDTTITTPDRGTGRPGRHPVRDRRHGDAPTATRVNRVQVEVQDRDQASYLQDDRTTWGSAVNTIDADLATAERRVDRLVAAGHDRRATARSDPAEDLRHQRQQRRDQGDQEDRVVQLRRPPAVDRYHGPSAASSPATTSSPPPAAPPTTRASPSLSYVRDATRTATCRTTATWPTATTPSAVDPDVAGATEHHLAVRGHLPHEGNWKIERDRHRHGRAERPAQRRPRVASSTRRRAARRRSPINAPASMIPPTTSPTLTRGAGQPADLLAARLPTTQALANGRGHAAQQHHPGEPGRRRHLGCRRDPGWHRVSPANLNAASLQLVLHDAVQPAAGHVHLQRCAPPTSRT